MATKEMNTAHYWADQIGIGDKQLRAALEDVEADGQRGESQPTYLLSTVFAALLNFSELDGAQERARKDKEAADKLALENAKTRGELCDAKVVAAWYREHVERANARLIQIPDAIKQLCDPRAATIIFDEARRVVYEAITELAADSSAIGSDNSGGMALPAEPEGERVGGSETKAINGKQRRTRAMAN